ncbi:MAG: transglutaminase-like domain-containing protein [Gemmatimonadaceae bacterium]
MIRRGHVGLTILILWVVGLALLARRELFQSDAEQLAEAALRVAPGAVYYTVLHDGEQIGFASSTIDTTLTRITVDDYFVADVPVGGSYHRATASSSTSLTRGLRLSAFDFELASEAGPIHGVGRVNGDTLLTLALATGGEPADTRYIRLGGPVLLPTIVPLVVGLGRELEIGRSYSLPVFDPAAMQTVDAAYTIDAESLFVVVDSARFDSTANVWVAALLDTVQAWHLVPADSSAFASWVDEQGRVVEARMRGGLLLRRMAYEIAFENWRLAAEARPAARELAEERDILETTAIAADALAGQRQLDSLAVRLTGVDLSGYRLNGGRQRLSGDTLIVMRETAESLDAVRRLTSRERLRFGETLRAEPLIESLHPEIVRTALRISGGERDPVELARRLNAWVHDSLEKRITIGIPSALQVLRSGGGDCNEHTQLYVALARALQIPARGAAGLAFVNGRFYYHAWPEVYLDGWVAVDPTFGQFPADASHLRFVRGGLARQAELLGLIGRLEIEILASR